MLSQVRKSLKVVFIIRCINVLSKLGKFSSFPARHVITQNTSLFIILISKGFNILGSK
jgi:hypothetical protein